MIGALVVNGALELLRSSSNARFLFYGVLLLALFVALRPWYKPVIVLVGTIAFGYAVHGIASAVWSRGPRATSTAPAASAGRSSTGCCSRATRASIAGWAYFALIVAALGADARPRLVARRHLDPHALSGRVCVGEQARRSRWPVRLRLILPGTLLVVIMNVRPAGIFGTSRVEIV